MKANPFSLDAVLGQRQQWVVPVYQRHYEWESSEDKQIPTIWENLRDEVLDRVDGQSQFPHFFGAIIYIEPQNQTFGTIPQRLLVDGQQRINTFHLILAAIREVARGNNVDRLVAAVDSYLFNEKTKSMINPNRECYKLWPSAYDRDLFKILMDSQIDKLPKIAANYFYQNGNLIKGKAPKLLAAFWFIVESIQAFIKERNTEYEAKAETTLEIILAGFLSGFQIVVIQLDPTDDAQAIFASLNGLGKPLSPFDLIRNSVFQRARKLGEDEEQLYDERWQLLERPFWSEEIRQGRQKRARADHMIGHALAAETAREINIGRLAIEYERFSQERKFKSVSGELDVLITHAKTYYAMEKVEKSILSSISELFHLWDMTTLYPIVFWVNAAEISDLEKSMMLLLVESYIVRRELCGLTTKNYNKVVLSLVRSLRESTEPYVALKNQFLNFSGDASVFPNDALLAKSILEFPVYNHVPSPRINYVLRKIEQKIRTNFDETTVVGSRLNIEHIMPKKWASAWPLSNGNFTPIEDAFYAQISGHKLDEQTKQLMSERQNLIDTLGNLTLLTESLNPSIGNSNWSVKRTKLADSLLAINRSISKLEQWNEESIKERGAWLAAVACQLWRTESPAKHIE